MAKLRNAKTDVGKMTQYLARKCVIHSPQAELDMSTDAKFKPQRFGKSASYKGSAVHIMSDREAASGVEPNVFVALSPKGRAIKVTVEEINPETLEPELFREVGT